MLAAIMAMAFVLDSKSQADLARLVEQLGSKRFEQRASAERELALLGREAVPALRAANVSNDATVRARSATILARIEDSLLLQATPIALDFEDVPLIEAVEALNRRASTGLVLSTDDRASLAAHRVRLTADRPLPYWKAMDALCSAGNLHFGREMESSDGTFLLEEGGEAVPGLVSDSGPFRVRLASIHYQSEIQLGQPVAAGKRSAARPDRAFYVQLVVAAEPRLSIASNGAIRWESAVDDLGQSVASPPGRASLQHSAAYFGMNPSPILRLRVDLDRPNSPGRMIHTLRGKIPVTVATRKPGPLVVPLDEAAGKVYRNDEAELTLLAYQPPADGRPASVQVAIKPLDPNRRQDRGPLPLSSSLPQRQIEILDSQGRPLSWFPSGTFLNGEQARYTLTLSSPGRSGLPATLRYYEMTRANADVAFEFRDIPMP